MKAVPKVNIDGLYLEDALVDDAFLVSSLLCGNCSATTRSRWS